jgi:hypothetical protein
MKAEGMQQVRSTAKEWVDMLMGLCTKGSSRTIRGTAEE